MILHFCLLYMPHILLVSLKVSILKFKVSVKCVLNEFHVCNILLNLLSQLPPLWQNCSTKWARASLWRRRTQQGAPQTPPAAVTPSPWTKVRNRRQRPTEGKIHPLSDLFLFFFLSWSISILKGIRPFKMHWPPSPSNFNIP